MLKRGVASILLILSMLYLPLWVTGVLSLGAMVYFRWFFEAVILFFFIDMVFGAPVARFLHVHTALTLIGLTVLLLIEYLKTRFRSYYA